MERRIHPKEQSRAEGDDRREGEHRSVDPNVEGVDDLRGKERAENSDRQVAHGDARDPRREREEHRLQHELAHQLGTAGTDRPAHRHLGRTGRAPRQQEIGDVRAGDEEDEARDSHKKAKRRLDLLMGVALATESLRQHDPLVAESLHRFFGHVGLQGDFDIPDDP